MPALLPEAISNAPSHISVCVCTYKRPQYLRRLLQELGRQETGDLFTYSIVVADNDRFESAKAIASELAATASVPITYCVEPQQNIALARNKAVKHSTGNFIAFIDDDEFPSTCWLRHLFMACDAYDADGVIGPVQRHFDEKPPEWIIKGKFYERPSYATGLVIDWTKGRTNNALIKKRIIPPGEEPFRPEFRTGEDQDFFRRMIQNGHVFVWSAEAVVYELVPPIRWKRSFMFKRALLQGTVSVLFPGFGPRDIAKTAVAIPAYALALPASLALGQHRFVALAVKFAYHLGKLLAVFHISPIRKPYVVE